ncbi:MAG: hypothetical protein EAZ95_19905 [Bacteroidetes bacterium]|nr:MAG: hypothetical protein EAZ95_19905 [Bacteroidota bacterium]
MPFCVAQDKPRPELDFKVFLAKFPKASLPYVFAVKEKAKFKKSAYLTRQEAGAFLTGFQNPDGANVSHYDALIEPFPFTKNPEGMIGGSIASGQRIAILHQNEAFVLVLTRVAFEQKGYDNVEGEQYLLHSYTHEGEPITVLPVAQRVQFDLHSNSVKGTIDAQYNINLQVEIYTVSGTETKTERYTISPTGKISEVK